MMKVKEGNLPFKSLKFVLPYVSMKMDIKGYLKIILNIRPRARYITMNSLMKDLKANGVGH